MVYLNADTVTKLASELDLVDIAEKAMVCSEAGQVLADRFCLQKEELQYGVMPCLMDGACGTKIVSMQPENLRRGLASVQGIMVLNDPLTGEVKCIMDGKALTAMRTGAVGAVGIRNLANRNAESLCMLGAGVQAYWLCRYACKVRKFKRVYVYDINLAGADAFKEKLRRSPIDSEMKIIVEQTAADAIRHADVVISATSASAPILPDDAGLLHGRVYIGIGAARPDAREYPDAFYGLLDRVYIDAATAFHESGDLISMLEQGKLQSEQVVRFGWAIKEDCVRAGTTSFFKSVGLSTTDLMVANAIYEQAKKTGTGQRFVD